MRWFCKQNSGSCWQELSRHSAQTQSLLWASTSTKNPNCGGVLYAEELIGPDTANTMPLATLDVLRDHGRDHCVLPKTHPTLLLSTP